jgi:glycerophosphoryl diester phosphodiesterase
MASFLQARQLGVDAIELDVHATVDGHVVVLHDYDLARTTSGTGLVHERDLAYVRSLSAGSWFAPEFEKERVPLLSEVLAIGGLDFELEVKGLPTPSLVNGIAEAVTAAGATDRTMLTGSHLLALARLGTLLPGAQLGLFSPPFQPWMSDRLYEQVLTQSALSGGFDIVYVPAALLARIDIERLHDHGLLVHVGLLGPEEEQSEEALASIFARGIAGVTTNEPEAAMRARAKFRTGTGTASARASGPALGDPKRP